MTVLVSLTSEELLRLQMLRDKLGIEKEWLRQSLEMEKLELQQYRLDLIKASKLTSNADSSVFR